ncbi:MAG: hypothetical protein ACD_39C01555G0002 [uncultured bacterium]|nr:MAG: hypothetical protein ACD_39C01555G0002 [uncultured bacterium]
MQIKNGFVGCFHSLGLAVLPILGIFAENVDKFVASELVLPVFLSLSSVILGLIVFTKLTGDLERASLAVSTIFFATVYYGPLASTFVGDAGFGWPSPNGWFAAVWLLFWGIEAYLFAYKVKNTAALRSFANVFVAVLLFFVVSRVLNYHLLMKPTAEVLVLNSDLRFDAKKPAELPDIYYIILDSYAGNDVLQDLYGFDNSEFAGFLAENGFYCASQSRTNYPLTYFSLASSLNMGYLSLGPGHSSSFHGFSPLVDLIADNLVTRSLKRMGYQTIAFSSGYMATEMKQFDLYLGDSLINREFLSMIARKTFAASCNFGGWSLVKAHAEAHRNNIKRVLSKLPQVAKGAAPSFVFAHILAPHAPFVFNQDGSNVDLPYFDYSDGIFLRRHMKVEAYRKQFVEQLRYLNVLVRDCVTRLLADSSRRKVIIIQADHGPASDVDYTSLERSNAAERMSILNAIYLPEGNYEGFNPSLSPVNNFRAVFKNALHQNVDLLPDRSYYLTFRDLYDFKDITDLVSEN